MGVGWGRWLFRFHKEAVSKARDQPHDSLHTSSYGKISCLTSICEYGQKRLFMEMWGTSSCVGNLGRNEWSHFRK
ncbi:hypothetical protein Scep_006929 [Stephania cephalantha]|uniref:Uncharacterized protein n=1 Tax=Stephania cephalantha TaxID=152367 RepID=A0AAP0KBF8_9MAGN